MIVDIGLSGGFALTGLRVMVKPPDSRKIPGFILAISRPSSNSTCVRSAGTIAGWNFWEGHLSYVYYSLGFLGFLSE